MNHQRTHPNSLGALMLGAIGIIYGDIGTSPLYSFKICFAIGGFPVNELTVLGILSLFIWSLILIVTIKYTLIVLRMDDQGEGGVLVISSLVNKIPSWRKKSIILSLGIIGAALIFSDGIITPAISVLSAMEGLKLISPFLSEHIVLFSIIILTFLFYIQRRGTATIGTYFGPIMFFWFFVIGGLGLYQVLNMPSILVAFNPLYAWMFFIHYKISALLTMGGVILVITGAEAIYADLGHFGRKPIQYSWLSFVLPMLILNYLGQGALLLSHEQAIENPFYYLVPEFALYPMIFLATLATIIASQAVISSVHSLCWQAIMLNYIPRLQVRHTSFHKYGQIFVPAVNVIMWFLTMIAVVLFRESENLGVAYGLAVASTLLITSFLTYLMITRVWQWSRLLTSLIFLPILTMEIIFFVMNVYKIFEGAWFTVLISLLVIYIVKVWQEGNLALQDQKYIPDLKLKSFLQEYKIRNRKRLPGTAIFMTRVPDLVPTALLVHLEHNKLLHHKLIFITIETHDSPTVKTDAKYSYERLMNNTYSIIVRYGYMENPNTNNIMHWAREHEILELHEETSFFFSKGIPVISKKSYLSGFGEQLYIFMVKNAVSAYEFFKIPHHKVVELGVRYKI